MDKRVGETRKVVKSNVCEFDDTDLLVAVLTGKNTTRSTDGCTVQNNNCVKKRKRSKGISSLHAGHLTGARHPQGSNWAIKGSRTVLSWLLHYRAISPNDVIQLQNPKDDSTLKEGLVTKDGLTCLCCNKILSLCEFEIHSDLKSERPLMNLVMESGKPLALCKLEAWSSEYQAKQAPSQDSLVDGGDDVCGLCGLEGDFVWCDHCPATFHLACLFEQLPEGNWYCPKCRCCTCWDMIKDKDTSISPGALNCSMCESRYHEACMKGEVVNNGLTSGKWFCRQSCRKLHEGLQSSIGLRNSLSDEVSWTLLHCMDGDYKAHSSRSFISLKAECNSKLAVAITLLEDYFLQMLDGKTNVDMIPQAIYNRRSKFPRLNFEGFYTVVLEKRDVVASVASIRCHGVQVAELPFVATCSRFRNQGLCRMLVSTIEKMLNRLGVKKFAVAAAHPDLVEMWTNKYGFRQQNEEDRTSFRKINLMVLPGSTWLVKSL